MHRAFMSPKLAFPDAVRQAAGGRRQFPTRLCRIGTTERLSLGLH